MGLKYIYICGETHIFEWEEQQIKARKKTNNQLQIHYKSQLD